MCIEVPNGMISSKLYLTKVLFSPEVRYTLVSIRWLDQCSYTTTKGGGSCTIWDKNNSVMGQIPHSLQGIYCVTMDPTKSTSVAVETLTPMEIHCRMGHISMTIAAKLIKDGLVTGIQIHNMPSVDLEFCKSCIYAKATHKPVAKAHEGECASTFSKEVHSDLWGSAPVATLQGHCYYVSFTDDKTQLTSLYLLQQKSNTLAAYREYKVDCHTQFGARISVLHSD